jgi:hypothetical protein
MLDEKVREKPESAYDYQELFRGLTGGEPAGGDMATDS